MHRRGYERARLEADEHIALVGLPQPDDACGEPLRVRVGDAGEVVSGRCARRAGQQTAHEGTGPCSSHGGTSPYWNARGAWMMGHKLAQPLDVSPWDALLGEVRRTAGEVAWLDSKVASAPSDEALLAGGSHYEWKRDRERQRLWLGRISKMAIDAGVAAMLVNREQAHADDIAGVLNRTLDVLKAAGLSDDLESIARSTMRRELLALESGALEGEIIDEEERQ